MDLSNAGTLEQNPVLEPMFKETLCIQWLLTKKNLLLVPLVDEFWFGTSEI